jgi:cytidylate kinase
LSSSIPIITVDGPAGAGKGTLAAGLAQALGFHLLDSGALYRMVAWSAIQRHLQPDDESALAAVATALAPRYEGERIFLGETDVTRAIRSEEVSAMASKVAAFPAVRNALMLPQRRSARLPGLIADGRDMGTVVFPDASCKFFITASAQSRAERRYKQLIEKGFAGNRADLLREIAERDDRDAHRAVAPLKPAPDATLIDTTEMSIENVLRKALDIWAGISKR